MNTPDHSPGSKNGSEATGTGAPISPAQVNRSLASYTPVAGLIFYILQPAIAGGLPCAEAEDLYNKILGYYDRLSGNSSFDAFCKDVVNVISTQNTQIVRVIGAKARLKAPLSKHSSASKRMGHN